MPTLSTSNVTPSLPSICVSVRAVAACGLESGDFSTLLGNGKEGAGECEREPVRMLRTLPPRSISTLEADSMLHSGSFLGSLVLREWAWKRLLKSSLRVCGERSSRSVCFWLRRRRQNKKPATPATTRMAKVTPMPMPACLDIVEVLLEDDARGTASAEDDGLASVAEGICVASAGAAEVSAVGDGVMN